MDKVMEFLREKFYYVVGVFGVLVIILVIVFSCSGGEKLNDYEKIENEMVESTKEYYNKNEKELPKTEEEVVSIKLSYLIENKYIKKIKDPSNKDTLCSGNVYTTKRGNNYKHTAVLKCGKYYKTKFLNDAVKSNLKLDSKGNGLYAVGEEFIFRGESLKNYIKFNDELWQIMRIDTEGDIKIIKNQTNKETYAWDDRYNIGSEGYDGINDFKLSRIRDTLNKYYKNHFNKVEGVKESIVKKPFCTGKRKMSDDILGTAECSVKNNLYVGLIYASEFYIASLDTTCKKFGQEQCSNYNYLAKNQNTSWTLTGSVEKSYRVFNYFEEVNEVNASNDSRIYPVIYLDSKTVVTGGTGAYTNPYVVK